VALQDGNELVLLKNELQADHRVRLPALIEEYLQPRIHLDSFGTILAVSHTEGVSVFDVSSPDRQPRLVWEVRHEPWHHWEGADCVIDRRSRLWWVRADRPLEYVVISNLHSGETITEVPVDESYGCFYDFYLHPGGDAAILDGAAGQDGSFLWKLQFDGVSLSIAAFDTNHRIMGGFDAQGGRFVTAPHHGNAIQVHRWTDGAVVDELAHEQVFRGNVGDDDCDCFDYCATFLDDGRIVVNTVQQRFLLLTTDPLEVHAELWPDGLGIHAYGRGGQPVDASNALSFMRDLQNWAVTRDGLLTTHGRGRMCVWALPNVDGGASPWIRT
jgi:hypothetical protein